MTQGKHGRAHSSVKQKTEKQTKPYYRHELKYYINYIDYLSGRFCAEKKDSGRR